jgi:hypothetical protein
MLLAPRLEHDPISEANGRLSTPLASEPRHSCLPNAYDEARLSVLQNIFELGCKKLHLDLIDQEGRERLAVCIFAHGREMDPDRILQQAVEHFSAGIE